MIDLSKLKGTGPDNRIILRDVSDSNYSSESPNVNRLRQAIAKATTHSKNNIPHFYLNTRVNMSTLLKYRKDQKLCIFNTDLTPHPIAKGQIKIDELQDEKLLRLWHGNTNS